jgi:O-methyltransferase involved in polyketide biosynthesis
VEKVGVELERVPETLLWTLHHRAVEARRPNAVLDDSLAVELVDRIDFSFAERFGDGERLSQWQALRARCFDDAVSRFLASHPSGTVAALGEGLETQFWRVDNGRVRWLTVDLPEVVALRRRLLPESDRMQAFSGSALDPGWMDEVDDSAGLLVTAQGLLMYFAPDDARGLIAGCAARFPGQSVVFDAVPSWLVERSRRGQLRTPGGYEPPPWSWGLDRREEQRLRSLPGIAEFRVLPLPRGRGIGYGALLPLANRVPALRRLMLSVLHARFR